MPWFSWTGDLAMDVAIDAVDRAEPIRMHVANAGTFAVLSMLAEHLAAHRIRLVSFDLNPSPI